MMHKEEVLNDFYALSEYLHEEETIIEDLKEHKNNFFNFLNHAEHINAYNLIAPHCKDKKVLDIGCFLGYGERILSHYVKELIAIDSNDKAIEFAHKRITSPKVRFQKADARQLPFPDKIFEIVIALQLIEHLPLEDVNNFLCEVKRVLKEGSTLFLVTPNRKFRLLPFQRPFNKDHYQEFTAKRLFKTLSACFEEVGVKGVRARSWIQEMESKRLKSPYRTYIHNPIFNLVPTSIRSSLRKHKAKVVKLFQPEKETSGRADEFNRLFQKFSMNVFFLEDRVSDKSFDLFAICKK